MGVLTKAWAFIKAGASSFIADQGFTRAAAIAFYAVSAATPLLYLSAMLAGIVMGNDVARSALIRELGGIVGHGAAVTMGSALRTMSGMFNGFIPNVIGSGFLALNAAAVFVEVQDALNAIWKTPKPDMTVGGFLRSWGESLLVVLTLGVVLLASMLINAVLGGFGSRLEHFLGLGAWLIWPLNLGLSSFFIALMFGTVYMVLPNRELRWHDVAVGAVVTTLLFQVGEILIGFYIGITAIATRYGAAGSLIVALTWVYYSAVVFLLGAEYAKVWTQGRRGLPPVSGP